LNDELGVGARGEKKMSNSSTASSGGIGVLGLLGVVFVTLKLIGVIDWPWWWVTAPFWGGLALVLAVLAVGVVGITAHHFLTRRKRG
jgi:pilus assembly protein TadC